MNVKKSLWEYGKSVLRELVKEPEKLEGTKPAHLEDLKIEDMKREKLRLGLEKQKTLKEINDLETHKRELFEEGVKASGTIAAKMIATDLKSVDTQIVNLSRVLDSLIQQSRLVDGLLQAVKISQIQKDSGIGAMLQKFDMQELVAFIDKNYIDGVLNDETMGQAIDIVEHQGPGQKKNEDPDVLEIMGIFERARIDGPEVIEQNFQEMNNTLGAKRIAKENPESEDTH